MKTLGEAELRNIVVNAVDGIITIDERGTVESVNPAAEMIFGYKADEMVGRNIKMLMPDPYHSEHDGYLENYRDTGVKKIIGIGREVLGRRKDGTVFPIDLAVSEVKFADHRVFTGVVRDITERKLAEQALKDSESRHRAILETVVDGIITIDERGKIESLNPAAERLFGYPSSELIGNNVKMLMPEPYKGEHDGYLHNYRETGVRKIIGIGREVIGQRRDGSTFPMDLAVSEVRLGDRRMFTGIVRDIAARKEGEAQLRETMERAESANKAKDHFLAVVSHELRTPLNPIMATAQYLESARELPATLREEIAVIRRNVEQEARMVDDLLNLTRLQRNKIDLHQEVVNAEQAIHQALTQFQRDIVRKKIDLLMSLRAENHQVWADPGRIEQVLVNLLSNAVKFTPERGRITLRSENTPEGRLRIEVSDTGVGIEPEVLPLLFQPFEQGDRTTSRRFGGLGLGLVISKGIIDLHHGVLTASSEGKNKGTTFTIELNSLAEIPDAPPPEPEQTESPQATAATVLLVEDHQDTLRCMTRVLKVEGHRVLPASSVTEASDHINREHIDLLVSDIGLPDGSGLDVMQEMKLRQPHAKGIALSGFGLEEDKRRSREAGFLDHIVKPVNIELLQNAIRSAISESR